VRKANPTVSAKGIWNLLRKEIDSAEPIYDIDCILLDIGSDEIRWRNAKNEEKFLSFRSFENRLSRLKSASKAASEDA
jgi:hypothetical protein